MLIALPFLVFLLLAGTLLGWTRADRLSTLGLGEALLPSAVFCGAAVVISTEALSLVHGLNTAAIAVVWAALGIGIGLRGWRSGALRSAWGMLKSIPIAFSRWEWALLCGMGLLGSTLLLVAWISPPNNVDSLLYHVIRTAHWAQDQSLEHYATARQNQLLKPIWAETAILHLRLLWGSDRPSNLVQWSSMMLSVFGVAVLAARLGASRTGQIVAAAFAMTLPAGVLQSSSTQNDYVVALWTVCTAHYVLTSRTRDLTRLEFLGLGLVLGIGFLTKGTFYVYAPPLMLWYFLSRLRRRGPRPFLIEGATLVLIAAALNAGFWARNIQTYGGPYGPSDFLQRNLWIRFLPTPPAAVSEAEIGEVGEPDAIGVIGAGESEAEAPAPPAEAGGGPFRSLAQWAGRVARTAAFNLVTPSRRVNDLVRVGFARFPGVFDDHFLGQWDNVAWSHEDTAPNTLHMAIAFLSIAGAFLVASGPERVGIRKYALVVLAMFGMIPIVIGHGPSIWGMRYQLPFFVMAAPVVGGVWTSGRRAWPAPVLGIGLLIGALPWLLFNNTRPLIGRTPWPTRVGSILATPPAEVMFAVNPRVRPSYQQAVRTVQALSCRQVGLRIDSGHLEYLFWWLFGAPEDGTRIETIHTFPNLEPLLDRDFHPCAILCTICQERTRLHGLPLVADLDRVDVFAGEGFVWDPDG